MKVEKVQIQNFRCIVDSGELALDERLTALVGENECGKTSILEALRFFNRGENFDDGDISTLTVAGLLHDPGFNRTNVPMVTVWVRLEANDLTRLGLPEAAKEPLIKIVKKLDNDHDVDISELTPHLSLLEADPERTRIVGVLERVKNQLSKIYDGYVKDKRPHFNHVWLERYQGESTSENLVLFAEWAENIWDDLKTGDHLQVTRIAEDPYGRNSRALNAGLYVDLAPLKDAIQSLLSNLASGGESDQSLLQKLNEQVEALPVGHPVRGYFPQELIKSIAGYQSKDTGLVYAEKYPGELVDQIKANLPDFIYVPETTDVEDYLSIRDFLSSATGGASRTGLVGTLAKGAGLSPYVFQGRDATARMGILADKSRAITNRIDALWPGLRARFAERGQRLALGIAARGNEAEPTRRSAGLRSFMALFRDVQSVSDRQNVVLMFDDPGVHLHPTKMREISKFLAGQEFQVIIATHLPYMIDPDTLTLDKVRVIVRTEGGSRVESDWSKASDALETVFGSLAIKYARSPLLVVEGKDDWAAYSRLSDVCKEKDKTCLPHGLDIAIAGGANNTLWVVTAFRRMGVQPIVLLDGDTNGTGAQEQIRGAFSEMKNRVITLKDIFERGWKLEHLLGEGEQRQAKEPDLKRTGTFAEATLDKFSKVFVRIADAYSEMSS